MERIFYKHIHVATRMVYWTQKKSLIGKVKARNGRRSEDGSVWRSNKGVNWSQSEEEQIAACIGCAVITGTLQEKDISPNTESDMVRFAQTALLVYFCEFLFLWTLLITPNLSTMYGKTKSRGQFETNIFLSNNRYIVVCSVLLRPFPHKNPNRQIYFTANHSIRGLHLCWAMGNDAWPGVDVTLYNNLLYRVIKKKLDTTLEIYFWDWVYQTKDWFINFDKWTNYLS